MKQVLITCVGWLMLSCFPLYLSAAPLICTDTLVKISYKRTELPRTETTSGLEARFGYEVVFKRHFFFNDSLAVHYLSNDHNPDPYRKPRASTIGHKVQHHTEYILYDKGVYLHTVNFPKVFDPVLLVDTLQKMNWTIYDQTQSILGYNCYLAIAESEKKDSVMVWFTTQLPFKRNIESYHGLPGVVLEVYDQRFNYHEKAYKVEFLDKEIVLPMGIPMLDKQQWAREKRRRQLLYSP